MSEKMTFSDNQTPSSLFNKENLKMILWILGGMLGIIIIYNIFSGLSMVIQGGNQGRPPMMDSNSISGPPPLVNTSNGLGEIWPLWGQLAQLNSTEILFAIGVLIIGLGSIWIILKKVPQRFQFSSIVLSGFTLIVCTNLIHGWELGIYNSIGGQSEIYTDAIAITNIWDFISNYENIQPLLTVHAQTQPPGAVIFIYLLSTIFSNPGYIAIAIAGITTFFSAIFMRKLYLRWFEKKEVNYGIFIFLLLPAIQVYYLANIYAIVATLVLGTLYFYFHSNKIVKIIGTALCMFLVIFTSFLGVFIILTLGLYELLKLYHQGYFIKEHFSTLGPIQWIKNCFKAFSSLVYSLVIVVGILLVFWFGLNFNYLNAFLFASSLENPNGFMLFSDPGQYLTTRIQDILDIAVFFGPILIVLAYQGIKLLKNETQIERFENMEKESHNISLTSQAYFLIIAALLGLLLMFLAGAPKKGETARICMFILPFLIIPVITQIKSAKYEKREIIILLALILIQTVIMQSIATYVW